MNGSQKSFLFQFIVVLVAVAVCIIIYLLSGNIEASVAGWAILALLGFEKKVRGDSQLDERDNEIREVASRNGYTLFWAVFFISSLAGMQIFNQAAAIPVRYISHLPFVSFAFMVAMRSLSGLTLYRSSS